jgi:hypothetical protein
MKVWGEGTSVCEETKCYILPQYFHALPRHWSLNFSGLLTVSALLFTVAGSLFFYIQVRSPNHKIHLLEFFMYRAFTFINFKSD